MNFMKLSEYGDNLFSEFPPILDTYLLRNIQVVGVFPKETDFPDDYSYYHWNIQYALTRLINVFCNEFVGKTQHKVDRLRETMNELIDKMKMSTVRFCVNRFKDNLLVMILVIFVLEMRKTKIELDDEMYSIDYNYKKTSGIDNMLYSSTRTLLSLLDRDFGKNAEQMKTVEFLHLKSLVEDSFPHRQKLVSILKELLETLDLHIEAEWQFYWHEKDLIYNQIYAARSENKYLDKFSKILIYGTIHWLVSVFNIPIKTACYVVYDMLMIINIDKDPLTLNREYYRFRKSKMFKPLVPGESAVYV